MDPIRTSVCCPNGYRAEWIAPRELGGSWPGPLWSTEWRAIAGSITVGCDHDRERYSGRGQEYGFEAAG